MNSEIFSLDDLKKMRFKSLGKNLKISKNVTIIGEENISFGDNSGHSPQVEECCDHHSSESRLPSGSSIGMLSQRTWRTFEMKPGSSASPLVTEDAATLGYHGISSRSMAWPRAASKSILASGRDRFLTVALRQRSDGTDHEPPSCGRFGRHAHSHRHVTCHDSPGRSPPSLADSKGTLVRDYRAAGRLEA